MTDKHPVRIDCGEKGAVIMKGQYSPYQLQKWDFFFAYPQNGTTGKFYRVPENSDYQVGRCICWWTVEAEGMKQNSTMGAKKNIIDDGSTTSIDGVESKFVIDAIYDLNGRKLDIDYDELNKGLYIINGKKVVKK